jgi:predicted helicase
MIDWPRTAVMDHLLPGSNLALVARRQSPASQPCSYFWVTDCITVDGLIRSDNRGSESVFPLYARQGNGQSASLAGGAQDAPSAPSSRQPNFSDRFIDLCCSRIGLTWQPSLLVGSQQDLTPWDLFHYIYALFHAPGYRERYSAQLRVDFPRVLVTDQPNLLRVMAAAGRQLVELHLLREVPTSPFTPAWCVADSRVADTTIHRGYPKYRTEAISINPHLYLSPVPPSVWDFHVGAYQVCRKWLLDRRERSLCEQELREYAAIVQAIGQTMRVMREIEDHIAGHGGWEVAFPR